MNTCSNPNDEYPHRKLVTYLPFVALLLLPLTLYPLVDTSIWISSSDMHAAFEFTASLLALTAGIMVMLNYFSTGRVFFLVISLGFILIGTEEFVHAVFSLKRIWPDLNPIYKLAISSTWLTGRFILVASLLIALLFGKRETVPAKRVPTVITYSIIGLISAAMITIAIFMSPDLPAFVQLGSISKKSIELCLALLFFVALLCYTSLYFKQQSHSPLLWSIVACIIFEALAHIFVFNSQAFYDSHWDAAHLLVIVGYFFPIFGIWGENLKLHQASQLQVIALEKEITDRKLADEALARSEEKYRSLVETASAGIGSIDLEGKLIFANARACRWLGLTEADVLGQPFADFVHPADLPGLMEMFFNAAGRERAHPALEFRIVGKDGQITWLNTIPTPIILDGETVGFNTILQDITENKLAEEKLAENALLISTSNEELRSALAEKEALLKEVHHRVKNNLMVISSLLNLQMSHTADRSARASLQESAARVMSIGMIHEQVLRSGEYADIDCISYINSLVSNIRNSVAPYNKEITLKIDVQHGITIGMERAVSLGLIINELVSNSFQHAFRGSEKGEISIACRGSEGQVQLSIKDSGMGIPHEVDMDNPSSLGLQLVSILVKQLKGTIKYEIDNGAKFTITFSHKPESIQEVKEYAG